MWYFEFIISIGAAIAITLFGRKNPSYTTACNELKSNTFMNCLEATIFTLHCNCST